MTYKQAISSIFVATGAVYADYKYSYHHIGNMLLGSLHHESKKRHESVIIEAVNRNDHSTINYLLCKGMNMNMKIENRHTPLMMASAVNSCDVITALINAGADIEAKTPYGTTAMNFACMSGHHDAVAILIENGVEVTNEHIVDAMTFEHPELVYELEKNM